MTRRKMLISAGTAVAAGMMLRGVRQVKGQMAGMGGMDGAKEAAVSGPKFKVGEHAEMAMPEAVGYRPVAVPNGTKLPWKMVDGWKVFHLVAEEVEQEFAPGLKAICWGYNGSVHGPVIEAVEGDRVRIFVTNRLSEGTTVHWHGMRVPNGMDGVGGLTQKAIAPGETFLYEFELVSAGTFMYHSHHDEMTQMALGLTGMFIIHPKDSEGRNVLGLVDRDFVIMLHEWRIDPGAWRPDPNEMVDFNMLTMNGKAYPGTDALVVKKGERVRIRLGNLGAMDHHPMHLHGYDFILTESDQGIIPEAARYGQGTVLVPVGSTRVIEFTADAEGDWAFHCHMTHHVMNQMGHGLPNMVGADLSGVGDRIGKSVPGYMPMGSTGMSAMGQMAQAMGTPSNSIPMAGGMGPHDYITMGGMFTILKVRAGIRDYGDPGWYVAPDGTVATLAPPKLMFDVGIDPSKPPLGVKG